MGPLSTAVPHSLYIRGHALLISAPTQIYETHSRRVRQSCDFITMSVSVVDGPHSALYAKVAPRRPNSGAIYDNVVPIAKGAGKTLQAIAP